MFFNINNEIQLFIIGYRNLKNFSRIKRLKFKVSLFSLQELNEEKRYSLILVFKTFFSS